VGVRNTHLDYVVRAIDKVDPTTPAHKAGDPHSEEFESIDGNLTAHMSHNHQVYKVDNGMTFNMIKTSIRGQDIAATIALFCYTGDGRGALLPLQCWEDNERSACKRCLGCPQEQDVVWDDLCHSRALHWKPYITLAECDEHIPVQVHNNRARVTYLLDSFKKIDLFVLAAMAAFFFRTMLISASILRMCTHS
jgi:hypothetical protein